jgi:hypothetical protein
MTALLCGPTKHCILLAAGVAAGGLEPKSVGYSTHKNYNQVNHFQLIN